MCMPSAPSLPPPPPIIPPPPPPPPPEVTVSPARSVEAATSVIKKTPPKGNPFRTDKPDTDDSVTTGLNIPV